jgi:peptide/nickel transport system permease protein
MTDVDFADADGPAEIGEAIDTEPARSPLGEAWFMFRRNKAALGGLILLGTIIVLSVFGPMLYTTDPFKVVTRPRQSPGESELPLGSDYLGRDVFAGILAGGRVTLIIALSAGLMTVTIGLLIGAPSGYYGGRVEGVLMRITELFQVLPAILFAMVILTLWGATVRNVVFAIAIVAWPQTARLARAEFLRLRNLEYVRAARAMGVGDFQIMTRIILPNAAPPLIVSATLVIGAAILFEAGLSFLGLGDPNTVTWGQMLGNSRPFILETWWAVTFPGVAIFLTVLAISLVGDGLNDAFNPKLRER